MVFVLLFGYLAKTGRLKKAKTILRVYRKKIHSIYHPEAAIVSGLIVLSC